MFILFLGPKSSLDAKARRVARTAGLLVLATAWALTAIDVRSGTTAVDAAAPTPAIATQYGAVSGLRTEGMLAFKGIPFAEPPVGALRWREPRPPLPWTGTREAHRFADACMQDPTPSLKAKGAVVQVAAALGLDGAKATIAQLRAVPASKFPALQGAGLSLAPSLVIGDPALPTRIISVFSAGDEAPLPLLIGSNSDEATVVVEFGVDPAKTVERLGLGAVALKTLYPDAADDEELGRESMRDIVFTSFARRIASLHSRRAPTWRYYFSYIPVDLRDKLPGVGQGGEIAFVFGTADLCPCTKGTFNDADRAMSRRVGDYWVAFARTGVPSASGSPPWPRDTARDNELLELGDPVAVRKHFMESRVNVFIALESLF